nr:MAG TPA: inner membrane protein [Caudoviricetes sp.]
MEFLGILATLLVLVSFLFSKEKNIRIINIIGALLFVLYGASINSFSIWVLNLMLIIVHLYKLYRNEGE